MNNLRKNHTELPLIGVNKWESQEGEYAYAKAYMFYNDLNIVRVAAVRYDSCFYMIRNDREFKYEDYVYEQDLNAPSINHCTSEVIELAKFMNLIPIEVSDDE